VYWYVMQLGVNVGRNLQFLMGGISLISLLLAITGLCLLMVLPAGLPLRLCGIILCLPLFLPTGIGLSDSEVEVTVLDVGQGLAAIVRTARHVLVYDTGDHNSERFDAGRDIVAPALRNMRDKRIDMLMISHSDSDHAGGRNGLLGEFSAIQLWSGTPEKLASDQHAFFPCRAGMQWRWDGVIFKVLHPDVIERTTGNNRSCVLLLDTGTRRMLLTGDIEGAAEQQILRSTHDIRSDVLLAPHHGSKTSSTPAFLDAVNPQTVVVSSGYHNRFHHPAVQVTDRYRDRGIVVLNTAETGAIRMRFNPAGSSITTALCEQRFFWRIERYNAHCQIP
jgi:competence protein ComEC